MAHVPATKDALVVGGSIHDRLALRMQLSERGFRVTITRSIRAGWVQLSRHHFALCVLDVSNEERPRVWRLRYRQVAATRGTTLYETTPPALHEPASGAPMGSPWREPLPR